MRRYLTFWWVLVIASVVLSFGFVGLYKFNTTGSALYSPAYGGFNSKYSINISSGWTIPTSDACLAIPAHQEAHGFPFIYKVTYSPKSFCYASTITNNRAKYFDVTGALVLSVIISYTVLLITKLFNHKSGQPESKSKL